MSLQGALCGGRQAVGGRRRGSIDGNAEQLWAERPWTAMLRAYQPPKRRALNHQDARNNKSTGTYGGNDRPCGPFGPFGPLVLRERLDRLEAMALSILLWSLDAGDPKAIRFYLDTFRRMPDGSVRARPLPRLQPLTVKPLRPPTVKKLAEQDRRRAREAARALAAEAIVADVHERGAETYAALAAVLPAWHQPPRWRKTKPPRHQDTKKNGNNAVVVVTTTMSLLFLVSWWFKPL